MRPEQLWLSMRARLLRWVTCELDALSRRERQALRSRMVVLITHLLKWHYQPAWRTPSWHYTVREQRLTIADVLSESPSLRAEGTTVVAADDHSPRAT